MSEEHTGRTIVDLQKMVGQAVPGARGGTDFLTFVKSLDRETLENFLMAALLGPIIAPNAKAIGIDALKAFARGTPITAEGVPDAK